MTVIRLNCGTCGLFTDSGRLICLKYLAGSEFVFVLLWNWRTSFKLSLEAALLALHEIRTAISTFTENSDTGNDFGLPILPLHLCRETIFHFLFLAVSMDTVVMCCYNPFIPFCVNRNWSSSNNNNNTVTVLKIKCPQVCTESQT